MCRKNDVLKYEPWRLMEQGMEFMTSDFIIAITWNNDGLFARIHGCNNGCLPYDCNHSFGLSKTKALWYCNDIHVAVPFHKFPQQYTANPIGHAMLFWNDEINRISSLWYNMLNIQVLWKHEYNRIKRNMIKCFFKAEHFGLTDTLHLIFNVNPIVR